MNATNIAGRELKRPRRLAFLSVRALLLFAVVVAAGIGWSRVWIRPAERQLQAVQALIAAGAQVQGDFKLAGPMASPTAIDAPAWLREIMGEARFLAVRRVQFRDVPIDTPASSGSIGRTRMHLHGVGDGKAAHSGRCKTLRCCS